MTKQMVYFHSTKAWDNWPSEITKMLLYCESRDRRHAEKHAVFNIVRERYEIYANTNQSKNDWAASGNDRHEGRGKWEKKFVFQSRPILSSVIPHFV